MVLLSKDVNNDDKYTQKHKCELLDMLQHITLFIHMPLLVMVATVVWGVFVFKSMSGQNALDNWVISSPKETSHKNNYVKYW